MDLVSLAPIPQTWQEDIHRVAVQFMKARVCFYDTDESTPYDPVTGEGGPTVRVIWSGKARVQHHGGANPFATDYNSQDTRSFLWQLDPDDNPPTFIQHGTRGRVLDGARDEALESLAFSVDSAINSQDMAVRDVLLKATVKPVDWDWGV